MCTWCHKLPLLEIQKKTLEQRQEQDTKNRKYRALLLHPLANADTLHDGDEILHAPLTNAYVRFKHQSEGTSRSKVSDTVQITRQAVRVGGGLLSTRRRSAD